MEFNGKYPSGLCFEYSTTSDDKIFWILWSASF